MKHKPLSEFLPVRLPTHDAKALKALAARAGVPVSHVHRHAIAVFLAAQVDIPEPEPEPDTTPGRMAA